MRYYFHCEIIFAFVTVLFAVESLNGQTLSDSEYVSAETQILTSILNTNNYSNVVPPSASINGFMIVFLEQINNIDETKQTMNSSSTIYVQWIDTRLIWTPSDYQNIEFILIAAKNIWTPDLVVLNSADSNISLVVFTNMNALVYYNGTVNLVFSAINLNTRCALNLFKFPFDKQTCTIQIGSWTMSSNQFDFELAPSQIFFDSFVANAVWDLTSYNTSTSYILDRFYYVYSDYPMQSANIILYLTRKPLYYILNSIAPSLVLNVANLILLALPNASQYTIAISLFTTISFNAVSIAPTQPVQSRYLPVLYYYYFFSIIFLIASYAWFVTENVIRANKYMPRWVELFCELMRRVFRWPDFDKLSFLSKNKSKIDAESPTTSKSSQVVAQVNKNNVKEFESNILTLNRFLFCCLLFSMFTLTLIVMVYLSS